MTNKHPQITDDMLDEHLDAVLRTAGTPLLFYEAETQIRLRTVMRQAMQHAAEIEREACAALCDSMVMALDYGGNEYYRPSPADRCANAIRARGQHG